MEGLWIKFFTFAGSLGVVALALRLVGSALRGLAVRRLTDGMRARLRSLTNFEAYMSGFLNATASQDTLQTYSSLLGYANARMLTQGQSVAALGGAAAGEVIMVWVASVMTMICSSWGMLGLTFIGIGFITMLLFYRTEHIKVFGQLTIALSLLMMGLMYTLFSGAELISLLDIAQVQLYTSMGGYAIFCGLLLGALITAATRSVTISVVLGVVLCNMMSALPLALGLAFGAPIGLLFATAIISSNAAAAARRAVVIHAAKVILAGAISAVLASLFLKWEGVGELQDFALIITGFSLNVILVIPLANVIINKPLSKLVGIIIPHYSGKTKRLETLSKTYRPDPALSLLAAAEEITNHTRRTYKMMSFLREIVTETVLQKKEELYQRIEKYEKITDRVQTEIVDYISDITQGNISSSDTPLIKSTISRVGRVSQIAEAISAISGRLRDTENSQHKLSDSQNDTINQVLLKLQKLQYLVISVMDEESQQQSASEIDQMFVQTKQYIDEQTKLYHPYNQTVMVEIMTYLSMINKNLSLLA